jgi:hypothetical protein
MISCLIASACSGPTNATYRLNQRFTLAPGDTARIAETAIRIRFEGVFNDTRCPADAMCIQGGDALVRIHVLSESPEAQTYDLHTGSMQPVTHEGLTIVLVELMPYPFTSRPPIAPGDYRATLLVTR